MKGGTSDTFIVTVRAEMALLPISDLTVFEVNYGYVVGTGLLCPTVVT